MEGRAAREPSGMPFRYLSVSNPCAKGENCLLYTSIVSQHKADFCSVQDAVQFIDFINTLRLTHINIYIRQVLTVLFFLVLLVLFINISKNLLLSF